MEIKNNVNLGVTKNDHYLGVILGLLVFIRTMPCYFWSVEDTIRPICAILILLICVFNISKAKGTLWILLCLASAYIWAVVFVDHSGLITLLNFIAFAFIPILKKKLVFETYKTFRAIVIFFMVASIVNYLFVIFGLSFGGKVIEPLNSLKHYKYNMYPFLVTIQGDPTGRFHAIFDEPGVVGTLCGLLLIAERMNLSKKGNLVLLLAGLLSLSFYFYVALILGLILFSSRLKHRWVVLSFFVVLFFVSYNNDYLYNTLWYRFEWDDEEKTFVGDNRNGGGLADYYESIRGTSAFFTGRGTQAAEEYSGAASLNLIIVKHGFIFVFLIISGFVILAFREIKNKRDLLFFFVFFILTLYQRPGFYNTSSLFLYTIVIYVFGNSNNLVQNNINVTSTPKQALC